MVCYWNQSKQRSLRVGGGGLAFLSSPVFVWDSSLWRDCLGNEGLNQPLALQKEKPTVRVYPPGSQFPQLCGDPQPLFLLKISTMLHPGLSWNNSSWCCNLAKMQIGACVSPVYDLGVGVGMQDCSHPKASSLSFKQRARLSSQVWVQVAVVVVVIIIG